MQIGIYLLMMKLLTLLKNAFTKKSIKMKILTHKNYQDLIEYGVWPKHKPSSQSQSPFRNNLFTTFAILYKIHDLFFNDPCLSLIQCSVIRAFVLIFPPPNFDLCTNNSGLHRISGLFLYPVSGRISGFICRISGRISGWPDTGYPVAA